MKNKTFLKFYVFSVIGVLIAAIYPLSMGIRVISDMLTSGIVLAENYPKYTIPYTPIAIAVFLGVLTMPLWLRYLKKYAFPMAILFSLTIFFICELLLEQKIIVRDTVYTTLEDWQTWLCISPVWTHNKEIVDLTALEVLTGEYNPAFKFHFYMISVILIVTLLHCFYGFANIILTKNRKPLKTMIIQSVASVSFLGMCIFACFTAFFRTGTMHVSLLSARLMAIFFILLGVTAGIFVGSFLLEKRTVFAKIFPPVTASVTTLLMYIGEMILLNGRVYRFGYGFFFQELPYIVLAPVDILIILLSGITTYLIFLLLRKNK